ncbi:hypothetical protein EJB05_50351 [Eragrostis curvula]|uniref:Uncharacterized protein n=1 Tax=Eragrostis curvula TaxID=38414 RepID=A0A5J9SYG1_9POAL|nr:hypothetical protein EJB05_50351 [Eragrostis curvula]
MSSPPLRVHVATMELMLVGRRRLISLLANLRKVGIVEIDDQIGTIIIRDWVSGIIKAEVKREVDKVSMRSKIWRNFIKPAAIVSGGVMLGIASCFIGTLLFEEAMYQGNVSYENQVRVRTMRTLIWAA